MDVPRQLLERQLAVVEERDQGLADFLEVVRRDVRRHPDGDPRRAVDQQVGELRGQDDRLLGRRGVVRPEVDRLVAQLGSAAPAAIGVRRHSVYRIAAGGSPSIEPKLP